ncbi:ATP-binding protein, partial [Candidatus Deferrimicrobium sp.]|uniref:ATP-binding response regulator n=1 Tax=Candidatus Deferrimicrobium sp. TaxID=3060586 RepID=UPI003C4CB231
MAAFLESGTEACVGDGQYAQQQQGRESMNPAAWFGTKVRRSMETQDRDLSRVIRWLAGIVAVVAALGLPAVYFAIGYKSMSSALRVEVEACSREMNRIASANPDMWEFDTVRIMGVLEQRFDVHADDSRRVLDVGGNVIAATVEPVPRPALVRSRPILESGRPVGAIEVSRTLRPLILNTGFFLLLGDLIGIAVYLVLWILPMAALRRALGQLAREKERAQVTLRSIADGFITTDADGNVEFMNRHAEGMTGWNQEEAAGRPVREVFNVLDGRTGQELSEPLAERQADSRAGEQNVLVARDGTRRLIDDSVAAIPGGAYGTAGSVLVFRDVTVKVREEEERVKWQKLESLGTLAGGIAHDFNNFLAAILGNISLAKQILDPGSKAVARLESAEKASDRASELAGKLLTFSIGGKPVRERISPGRVVRDSAMLSVHGTPVRCEFDIAEDLWATDADAGQIGQAIGNLVINSVQAMPDGGTVRIRGANVIVGQGELAYVKPGPYVKIEVADTGVGIPGRNMKRIFDPYFTTRENGSGLGLTTSYHIMKSHGGNLFVESEQGAGTTASLYLPASTECVARVVGAERDTAREGKWKVLVMDDEDLVREMEIGMLEHLGCEARGARDGSEAIGMYKDAAMEGTPF